MRGRAGRVELWRCEVMTGEKTESTRSSDESVIAQR